MSKLRLLFVKEAQAAYISHLDLMRTFQRVFPRTELEIKHTQGYHPHPVMSIVLPLPVGQSSDCELLDFQVTQETDGSGIAERLNTGLPSGLRVLDCYPALRPVRELAWLRAELELEYDRGVPEGAAERLRELFARPSLVIQKRTKHKDLADVDVAPMLKRAELTAGEGVIRCDVTVQAQNPGLNPQLLGRAVETHLPELAPDFIRVRRRAILDAEGRDFR
jgi:radical SAM-linked protein